MRKFNFLSKSSSQSCGHSSVTLASTVGSPSVHRRGTMLKLLSVLVLVLTFGVGQMWATTGTLTLSSSNKFGTTSGSTKNDTQGNTWTCTGNAIQNSYQSSYSGQQFGTSKNAGNYTFTCTIANATISSVQITAAAGSTSATYSISIGGTSKYSGSLSKTSETYGGNNASGSGQISIALNGSGTGAAVYLGSISVVYTVSSTKYTVNYDANGGSVSPSSHTQATAGAAITTPTPTKTGYSCTGWWTSTSGGTIRCNAGESYTPTATETVHAQWACISPTINTQPASANYAVGASPAALSVSATLSSGTLTYLWKVSTNGGSTWSNASGTNNQSTYAAANISTAAAGTTKYKCIVTNSTGSCETESNVATITVYATHKAYFYNGSTLLNPGGTDIAEGAAVTYSGSTPSSCDDGEGASDTFVGWATNTWSNKKTAKGDIPAGTTFYDVTASETLPNMSTSDVTYYAVFAKATGGGSTTLLSEDFSSITGGDNTTTGGNGTAWTKNDNFSSISRVNEAGGAVRLGTGSYAGYLITKQLTASIGDQITIAFKVKGWSSVEGNIQVSGNNSEFTQPSAITYTATMSGSFQSKSVTVTLTKANPYIKIATTANRAFLDDIVITKPGAPTYSNYMTTCCTPLGTLSGNLSLGQLATPAEGKLKANWRLAATTGIGSLKLQLWKKGSPDAQVGEDINITPINTTAQNYTFEDLDYCATYYAKLIASKDAGTYCTTGWTETSGEASTLGYAVELTDYGSVTGGTFSTNKARACAGDEVTLTATPASGYLLGGWTVLDGNSDEISAKSTTTNTFVFDMPASGVIAEATFCTQPTAPTGLSYTLNADATRGKTILSWTAVAGATGYVLNYTKDAVAQTPIDVAETSYTFNPLTLGTYTWSVQAKNACGESTSANGEDFIICPDISGASVTIADVTPVYVPASDTWSATISWTAVANATAYQYKLIRTTDSETIIAETSTTGTSIEATGLTNESAKNYKFSIKAKNACEELMTNYSEKTFGIAPVHTLSYNANGGSSTPSSEYKAKYASVTAAAAIEKTGYDFTGWKRSDNDDIVAAGASFSMPDANLTLTAQWQIKSFSVTFNKNHEDATGTMANQVHDYSTTPIALTTNTYERSGYQFMGWATSPSGNVVYTNGANYTFTASATLYAVWSKLYTVEWYVKGSKVSDQIAISGTTLTYPSNPDDDELEDCGTNTFMGWSESTITIKGQSAPADLFTSATGATTITSDKTFYAVFAKDNASTVFEDDMSQGKTSRTGWSSFNDKCYSETGGGSSCVRLSTGSYAGVMTMSANSNLTSPATITFKILHYGSENGKVALSASKGTFSTTDFTASSGSSSWQEVSSTLTGCDNTSTITFTGTANNRIYIKDISVVCGSTEDYQTSCCTTLGAVSNVSVTPGRTSATVSWDKLANASGYEYKLGEAEWATASVADANNPSISLSTLTGATSYAIQIRATGDGTTYCDKGTASAVTNFKTLSRVTAAVNDGERGTAQVSLNGEDWAASVDAADGTTIYLQATPSSASWILGSWGASNGDVASNLLTGWTDDVTVTANFAAAELPTLATPTGMSSSAVTAISATISWNAVANASSYAISCTPSATQGDVTESAGVCSCTLTGLSAGTAYTWNVQAVGDNISYKSGTACEDQNFTTVAKKPTAISITTPPTKTTYLEGDDFDATGLVVSVTYNNGESDGVYTTITPSTNLAVGTTKVTISATLNETTVSVDQAITVVKKYVLTFLNNGVEVSHKDLYEGAEYGTLPTLTAENACNATFTNFVGWTTDEIIEQQSSKPTLVTDKTTMSTADVTLNAVWSDFVPADYATTYTSNVTLPTENSSTDYYYVSQVTIGGVAYNGTKVGKSGNGGHFTINVPAGTKRLFVHGVSWYNEDNTLTISTAAEGVSISPDEAVALPRNSGMSGSSNNYTLASLDGTEYKTFTLTGVENTTTLTLTSSGRIDVFGIMASSSTGSGYYVTRCISSEVTIVTLTHGSTINVKNGEDDIASGDEIAAGTTLTITTNAASGYRVDNLRAYKTGDENTPVAITNGTLTMPIYGITITAEETAVYPVYVAVAAGQSTWGSVTINGEAGPAYVNEDDDPAIVATPNAGYQFMTWSVTGGAYDLGEKALTDASIAPQVSAEATFTATFEEKPMTGLTLSESALTVDLASGTASLSVTGYTPSDLLDAKKTIAWSSSDETVATVSNGTITLKKAGTATITAAWTDDGTVNATCALNVYQWNFTGYEVTTAPETLYSNGDHFDKSSVVIKAGYERSDNSSTKQVTLDAAEWTAKLDGSVIANNYTFALADNGKTLTLWVDETKVGEDYVLTVNAIPTDHFVINIWTSEISPIADKTSDYSMPNLSDQTAGAAATCKDHNLFVGWVEAGYKDEPEGHIVAANTAMTPSNKTYYAVWGKTGTITESISYGWETGDIASNWSMSGSGLTATTGSARTGTYGGSMTSTGTYVKTLSRYATPKGITYYIRKQSGNDNTNNYYVLRYSSDNSNWTEIESTKYTFKQLSNTTWTEVTCDLRAETYQNKYFEIRMISSANGSLDDIEFSYTTSGAVDYITDCVQRYQVTFNANGGTGSYDAIEKKEGATVTLPDGSALSRAAEHYHFNGWKVYNASTEEEISVSENQFTMPGAAVNAVAQWEEDPKGTVRYVGDEILNSSITRYAGQTYNLRTEVTLPANRKLVGWMLEGDETLYAPGREMTMPSPVQDYTYNVQIIDQLPKPSGVSFSDGEWVLVTNTNQLSAGDFVVIVANGLTNAMGTQANTNRGIASVTKHNEGQTITLTENVAKLFLQYGYREGEFALYDMAENGYLYASSNTSNDLKTSTTYSNRNYSWLITIGEGNIASIVAKGANSHNNLKYNTSASVFSSYASGQAAVQLYRYDGHKTVEITDDVNASAIYLDDADVVVKNGATLTIDEPATLDNVIVEVGGKVTNTNNLTVNDLTIKSEAGKSGQVTNGNKISVNGSLYMDVTFFKGATALTAETADRWYMISAPFDVNLSNGFCQVNGTPMVFGQDFDLFEYEGSKRAETGVTGWKRAQGKMNAGVACLIGFNAGQPTTIRLKAASTDLEEKTSISLQAFTGDDDNKNWNGVANPTLHYTDISHDVQTYNNEDGENGRKYIAYTASSTSFVVGTAFFVQETGTMTLSAATHDELRAPKRAEADERYEACVRIFRQEATEFADQMYVRASETALSQYEQGHDMITWNGTTGNTAMIWAENYGKRLAIEEAQLVNDKASYELGIFAPQAGTYRIAMTSEDDAELYLTYNGRAIWNLSMSECELELAQGQNAGYGLRLVVKAPSVVTGIENSEVSDQKSDVQKVIIDEHVYILRGGQMYDVNGKMVK